MQSSEMVHLVQGIDFLCELGDYREIENGGEVIDLPPTNVLTIMMVEMITGGEWQTVDHMIDDLMSYYDIETARPFWKALEGTQFCKKDYNNPVVGFINGVPLKRTSLINYTKKILEKVFQRSMKRGLDPLDVVQGLALALNTDVEDIIDKIKKIVHYYINKMDKGEIRYEQ